MVRGFKERNIRWNKHSQGEKTLISVNKIYRMRMRICECVFVMLGPTKVIKVSNVWVIIRKYRRKCSKSFNFSSARIP